MKVCEVKFNYRQQVWVEQGERAFDGIPSNWSISLILLVKQCTKRYRIPRSRDTKTSNNARIITDSLNEGLSIEDDRQDEVAVPDVDRECDCSSQPYLDHDYSTVILGHALDMAIQHYEDKRTVKLLTSESEIAWTFVSTQEGGFLG
jgi:hypothetical protein